MCITIYGNKCRNIIVSSYKSYLVADIENLIDCKLNRKLCVKVKKDGRDSDVLMKNRGYDSKELEQ